MCITSYTMSTQIWTRSTSAASAVPQTGVGGELGREGQSRGSGDCGTSSIEIMQHGGCRVVNWWDSAELSYVRPVGLSTHICGHLFIHNWLENASDQSLDHCCIHVAWFGGGVGRWSWEGRWPTLFRNWEKGHLHNLLLLIVAASMAMMDECPINPAHNT